MYRFRLAFFAVITTAVLVAAGMQLRELGSARTALERMQPGYIDVNFTQAMRLHHGQAIAMAQLMLDGRPTGLAPLARNIATAQLVELGEMQGWLRLWDEGFQQDSPNMTWMLMGSKPLSEDMHQYVMDCSSAPGGMVGLASNAELAQLRTLQGRERDALFLRLMLAHHEGGVPMARFAAEEASLPAVRKLAGRIVLDQSREIMQIQSMLEMLGSEADQLADNKTNQ